MICRSCNREIEEVLFLSHGREATLCPLCKRDPMGRRKLCFTQENEELCRLAENYYYKWLTSPKSDRDEQQYLKQAISAAEQSFALGNPRACVRMGYFYDKDYIGLDFGEAQRCRFAYNYYMRVIEHEGEFSAENDSLSLDRSGDEELRLRAARLLLDMLAAAPAELKSIDTFNFSRNLEHLRRRLGIEYNGSEETERLTESKTDRIFRTLSRSCFSRGKAPLMGVYRLQWEDAKAILNRAVDSSSDTKLPLVDHLRTQRVNLVCIACGADGNAAGDADFHAIRNSGGIGAAEPYLNRKDAGVYSGCVWLFFYNKEGKHRYLSPRDLGGIWRALEESSYAVLRQIIANNRSTDCTLFDDDVFCYSDRGWRRALEQLSENIGGMQE